MTRLSHVAIATIVATAMPLGCGTDDFSIGHFPEIRVRVGADEYATSGGEVSFGTALQLPITLKVEIFNPGNEDLLIESINWETDPATGQAIHNQYVELKDLEALVGIDGYAPVVGGDQFGLSFKVVYNPPAFKALDDWTTSKLVIKSNALNDKGTAALPEMTVSFSMPQEIPSPVFNPQSKTFHNALPNKPETETFEIGNDSEMGTAPFTVLDITLESPTTEFKLTSLPNLPALVPAYNDPGYAPVTFQVIYHPVDDGNDSNAVWVYLDTNPGVPEVLTLDSDTLTGDYALSYSHPQNLDFTNVNQVETRTVNVQSLGPAPLLLKEPTIQEDEASVVFSVTGFKVPTNPEQPATLVTQWPQALTTGKSIDFEVTYSPPAGTDEPPNGELVIPYEKPENGDIILPLYAGTPKPKIVLGPPSGNISVTADMAGAETGVRRVIVYNQGNGNLEIKGITVTGTFNLPSKVFQLVAPPAPGTIVPPHSLIVLDLSWDLSQLDDAEGDTETLTITYFEPFTGMDQPANFGLFAKDKGTETPPVASPGSPADYPGLLAGEPLVLKATGVDSGSLSTSIDNYYWFLTAKPAGSTAYLNVIGTSQQAFTPDVAGDYEVTLIVETSGDGNFLVSGEATVTLTVAP